MGGQGSDSSNVRQVANVVEHEKNNLKHIMDVLHEDKRKEEQDRMAPMMVDIPESEEEILKFLEMAQLENQPTEVLYQLADKLK